MSFTDFQEARRIAKSATFKALFFALCRTANAEQLKKLNAIFPEMVREAVDRTNSPDGKLSNE